MSGYGDKVTTTPLTMPPPKALGLDASKLVYPKHNEKRGDEWRFLDVVNLDTVVLQDPLEKSEVADPLVTAPEVLPRKKKETKPETPETETGTEVVEDGNTAYTQPIAKATGPFGDTTEVDPALNEDGTPLLQDPALNPGQNGVMTGNEVVTAKNSVVLTPTLQAPVQATDPIIAEIWQALIGTTPEEQAAFTQAQLSGMATVAGAHHSGLLATGTDLSSQVNAQVSQKIGFLDSAVANARNTVQMGMLELRTKVGNARERALRQIDGSLNSAVSAVDLALGKQQKLLTTGFGDATGALERTRIEGIQSFTKVWEDRVTMLRQAGEVRATTAERIAISMASGWKGGEGIEADRNEARRRAARETGAKFAAEIRSKANEAADQLASGIGQIPTLVNELVKPLAQQLATFQGEAQGGLNRSAQQSKGEARKQAGQAKKQVNHQADQAIKGVDTHEQQTLSVLENSHGQATAQIQASGTQLAAQFLLAASEMAENYTAAMEEVQKLVDGGDPPLKEDATRARDLAILALAESRQTQETALQEAFFQEVQRMDALVTQASGVLATTSGDSVTQANSIIGGMVNNLMSLAGTTSTGLLSLSRQAGTHLAGSAQSAVSGAKKLVSAAADSIAGTQKKWVEDLDASRKNVVVELDQTVGRVGTEAAKAAHAAAAEIQEKSLLEKAWDVFVEVASVVVKVLVAVVVFVAVAAFVILTFGTGLVALIAAGAIAGAIAGVASSLAADAVKSLLTWSNQFSSGADYAADAVAGAVGGAITVATAGVGTLLGTLIGSVAGSATDQATDYLFKGETWDTTEFLVSGTLGTLLGVVGSKWADKAIGGPLREFLLPTSGRSGGWNSFQKLCSQLPIFKNLTTKERGALWKEFTKSKIEGSPMEVVNQLLDVKDNLVEALESDDKVRESVSTQGYKSASAAERSMMINDLLAGWTGGEDQAAILEILKYSAKSGDLASVVAGVGKQSLLGELTGEYLEEASLLFKAAVGGGTDKKAAATAKTGSSKAASPASSATATLSGTSWISAFPTSTSLDALQGEFLTSAKQFVQALRNAGASVHIAATYRPPERAYLMHYAWLIAKGEVEASKVPARAGVDINWVHATEKESVDAAKAMVGAYGLVHRPSLTSRHTEGRAVDMNISWGDDLHLLKADGSEVVILGSGEGASSGALHAIGAGYGVHKLVTDAPHWSEDGH